MANSDTGITLPGTSTSTAATEDELDRFEKEISRLTKLQAQYAKILNAPPQVRAAMDPRMVLALTMKIRQMSSNLTQQMSGGAGNSQHLMDAAQGNLYQGPNKKPAGITGGVYGQQAYANQLGNAQSKADQLFKMMQARNGPAGPNAAQTSMGPAWQKQMYAGSEPPQWFKDLPSEQQNSLLGGPTAFQGLPQGQQWTPPTSGGVNLAPGISYNPQTNQFQKTGPPNPPPLTANGPWPTPPQGGQPQAIPVPVPVPVSSDDEGPP